MNWKPYVIWAAIAAAAMGLWYEMKPDPAPVNQWSPAQEAHQVADVPKTDITPPKVEVYASSAKQKLNLPPAVQADQHAHVVEATHVRPDDHPETVTTMIDDQTGKTETMIQRDPLPWLAAEQTGELRFDYGLKNGGAKVGRLSVREDLIQVKALHAGVDATLDTDGQYFLGAGVGYKW